MTILTLQVDEFDANGEKEKKQTRKKWLKVIQVFSTYNLFQENIHQNRNKADNDQYNVWLF